MDYLDQTYESNKLQLMRERIQTHLFFGSRLYLHSPQHLQEFSQLFQSLLDSYAPVDTAQFDHVFQIAVLRWRALWLDLAESEWLAAEGQRFHCELARHPRAVHTPNLDIFHEITRSGYPVLYGRIRVYHHEAHRIERRLARLQKSSAARLQAGQRESALPTASNWSENSAEIAK